MLKSPNTVLQSFITAVEEEKELSFAMSHWFETPTGEGEFPEPTEPNNIANVCGTSACIAGTVAYRMDPNSNVHCETMILEDVGIPLIDSDFLGSTVRDDATPEEREANHSLGHIFSDSWVYGKEWLADVTKEDVLVVLKQLVESNYSTWTALNEELSSRVEEE